MSEPSQNQQVTTEARSEQDSTSVPTPSGNNLDALAVGKWVIRDQSETRVSKNHVNTRFFIISDTHSSDRINEATQGQSADVLILCGDITRHSLIEEYKYVGQVLGEVDAPLKLVIPGNHDGSLDESRFWDEWDTSYNNWPVRKGVQDVDQLAKLFGHRGDAKKALERYGFQVLNEGHNTFNLRNGATLKVYASPYTPSRGKGEKGKRGSPYRAFQYGQENGHEFLIDEDVDIVITHGPPVRSFPRLFVPF
ncbi:hypothetical protein N8I77_002027 [Diaporthe amygdali]|uniref:Calcineurin-like phosphoesterase domain-containing protein n=1 Tax=Phomopsis amygdali TaxID=1214568 RepID=A0AAD9WBE6_PHOAM|nr:hypothetical protein N8I77_002027 [Diaporthe amygdali]